jgi:hypothetical protein
LRQCFSCWPGPWREPQAVRERASASRRSISTCAST